MHKLTTLKLACRYGKRRGIPAQCGDSPGSAGIGADLVNLKEGVPMITTEQAMTADVFHISHASLPCTVWRRNGATQTWKKSPGRFRVPVKYGLYRYGAITEVNASDYHVAGEPSCR